VLRFKGRHEQKDLQGARRAIEKHVELLAEKIREKE
jgi:hypothetical protein